MTLGLRQQSVTVHKSSQKCNEVWEGEGRARLVWHPSVYFALPPKSSSHTLSLQFYPKQKGQVSHIITRSNVNGCVVCCCPIFVAPLFSPHQNNHQFNIWNPLPGERVFRNERCGDGLAHFPHEVHSSNRWNECKTIAELWRCDRVVSWSLCWTLSSGHLHW